MLEREIISRCNFGRFSRILNVRLTYVHRACTLVTNKAKYQTHAKDAYAEQFYLVCGKQFN